MSREYPDLHVDVALVHAPVVNRNGETIGSAVTNLDLHDIARACRTYGVGTYWVITPYEEQRELVQSIIGHWTDGHGAKADSDRSQALSIIKVCPDLETMIREAGEKFGEKPRVLATCASERNNKIEYTEVRRSIRQQVPTMLLFGTAWGLADEAMALADGVLPPISGCTDFNHLSVRSAVSIILDRLLSDYER